MDVWWTEADDAELDVLTSELVDGVAEHRPKCRSCAQGAITGMPCPHIADAIGVVLEWRERRELESRARWLRRQREQLEYERDLLDLKRVTWR